MERRSAGLRDIPTLLPNHIGSPSGSSMSYAMPLPLPPRCLMERLSSAISRASLCRSSASCTAMVGEEERELMDHKAEQSAGPRSAAPRRPAQYSIDRRQPMDEWLLDRGMVLPTAYLGRSATQLVRHGAAVAASTAWASSGVGPALCRCRSISRHLRHSHKKTKHPIPAQPASLTP